MLIPGNWWIGIESGWKQRTFLPGFVNFACLIRILLNWIFMHYMAESLFFVFNGRVLEIIALYGWKAVFVLNGRVWKLFNATKAVIEPNMAENNLLPCLTVYSYILLYTVLVWVSVSITSTYRWASRRSNTLLIMVSYYLFVRGSW